MSARASHIDVFASTHTCLAALRDFALPAAAADRDQQRRRRHAEFRRLPLRRLITRIATTPSPHQPLYGLDARRRSHRRAPGACTITRHSCDRFLARWPEGSPAHASYYRRIARGPDYSIARRAGNVAMTLSIIMPVLDEAAGIEAALAGAGAAIARAASR